MNVLIPSKSNFIRAFLSPLSKIDNTPDIKITDDELTYFESAEVFLFPRYKCKVVDRDIDNFVLPDANKLIKALQCSDNDELGLNIENNYIHYKNKNFKFKYFLFDRSIKKSNEHVYAQLSKLEDEYDTKFSITKEDLKRVLKTLPLLTESSKLYLYTENNIVYGDLCDKKLQNTDIFTSILSDKFDGEDISKDSIIVNLELFRMLNALNFETANVYINSKVRVVNIRCDVDNATLNYVVSSHKS